MNTWFEGENEIDCSLEAVQHVLANQGELHLELTRLMPGITDVELVEDDPTHVTIRTNEGLMQRTAITRRLDQEGAAVEFDEEYEAGSHVTATAHFLDEFTPRGSGVVHRLVITGVEAPGFLGFLYRHLGSRATGEAVLASWKTHLEASP